MIQPKILVLGDAMEDVYFIGEATRLSPEAPIPVVKITETKVFPGGAANVVANLRALGADVRFPREAATHGCPVKSRLMVGNTQVARWDVGDELPPYDLELLDQTCLRWRPDGIVISDYTKGSITAEVIEWAAEQQTTVFVDTKKSPEEFKDVWTFFPNRAEFNQYENTYRHLPNVILKRGADGLQRLANGTPTESFKAYATRITSVCGAGDVVLATYVYSTLAGYPDALFRACIAAALAVEQPWTTVVTNEEIEARISA